MLLHRLNQMLAVILSSFSFYPLFHYSILSLYRLCIFICPLFSVSLFLVFFHLRQLPSHIFFAPSFYPFSLPLLSPLFSTFSIRKAVLWHCTCFRANGNEIFLSFNLFLETESQTQNNVYAKPKKLEIKR